MYTWYTICIVYTDTNTKIKSLNTSTGSAEEKDVSFCRQYTSFTPTAQMLVAKDP